MKVKQAKQSPKTGFFYENRYIFSGFFLTAVLLTIIYALRGIYPFGDRTILRVDLYHQYSPFLEELRSRLLNGQSLAYSWEGGLGKEFLTQMAYYTTSPFSILAFFFPEKAMCEVMLVIITLKICLSCSTFSLYIRSHFKRNDLSILIFGLLYAFCAFVTCYYWNVMWLDSVYLFPLLALGTERLVHENKHILYYVTLTLTMITNFYMAVIVCVFIALYFLIVLFANYELHRNFVFFRKRIIKFAIVSILAALSSLFILAPVAIALGQTQTSETAFPNFEIYTNIFQLLLNHFLGARPVVLGRNEDLPNIYTGVLTVMLLPAYFFNKKGNRREKRLISALLVFMLLCCCIKPLDFLIHGLHFPSNLPHRFTFIYSFLLLYIAYEAFLNLPSCPFRYIPYAGLIYLAVMLVTEYGIVRLIDDIEVTLSGDAILLNIFAMAFYSFCLYYLSKPSYKKKQLIVNLCLGATLLECLYSANLGIYETDNRVTYLSYMDGSEQAVEYIDSLAGDDFYRAEYRRFTTINDASLYHYPGLSIFSSLAPGGISAFMEHLGVAATNNSYRYYDPTPLVDALFDMQYVLNKGGEIANAEGKYTLLNTFGNVTVYKNDRFLPLGFLTEESILDWQTTDSQPFAVQNDFLKKAAGADGDMFTMITLDSITTENMDVTEQGGSNIFDYTLPEPYNLSAEPWVRASYTSDKDQYVYFYIDAPNAIRFIYHTSRENQDREIAAGRSTIDIGHLSAGETISFEFALTRRGEFERGYRKNGSVKIYAASYDEEVFSAAYEKLKSQPYEITGHSDTKIEGIVSAEKDSVLFTSIPYVDGWEVKVDGIAAEKIALGDNGVVGVKVPAGEHTVTFQYKLRIFIPAVIFSFLGILLFILYTRWDKKNPSIQPWKPIPHNSTDSNKKKTKQKKPR